jgi:sugar lactone lactonase YvrE
MKRILIALSAVLAIAAAVPAAAEHSGKKGKHRGHGPDRIALPDGFRPEGITTWKGSSLFFAGSIGQGDIYGGSLRSGRGRIVVDAPANRSAIGIKVDGRGRIFVAGGTNEPGYTKGIWVYDARSGDEIAAYPLEDAGFINDVVLTKRAAYFTDSFEPVIYRVARDRRGAPGELTTIPITGDLEYTPGFNANGIEATRDGRTLILVKSPTGELFTANAETGVTRRIDLGGGAVTNGDGLLLKGRTLYVVENRDNLVTSVKLSRDLARGRIERSVTDDDFDVPTTIARSRGKLYVVNARFNTPPTPETEYWVAKVPKERKHRRH